MIEASDYPGLWMSPALVKQRMDSTILKHGDTKTSGHGQFKREREVWTSAMFAFGLGQMNGNEYWVEIETVDATPDTRVHRIDPSSGHNRIETIDCEVVDWDEHVDDVMHVIKKKCLRAYPQSFFLLVLARNGEFLDFTRVSEEMKLINVPFFEVWIVGRSSQTEITMVRLFPGLLQFTFDVHDAIEKTKDQNRFLVKQKRGTSIEFRDLGHTYLPIP